MLSWNASSWFKVISGVYYTFTGVDILQNLTAEFFPQNFALYGKPTETALSLDNKWQNPMKEQS